MATTATILQTIDLSDRYSWGVWVLHVAFGRDRYVAHVSRCPTGYLDIRHVGKLNGVADARTFEQAAALTATRHGRNMRKGARRNAIEAACRQVVGARIADSEASNDEPRQLPADVKRFRQNDGTIIVARRHSDGFAGSGWYGGIDVATFWRNGFSCGARYFFGDDIALLGEQVEDETKPKCLTCAKYDWGTHPTFQPIIRRVDDGTCRCGWKGQLYVPDFDAEEAYEPDAVRAVSRDDFRAKAEAMAEQKHDELITRLSNAYLRGFRAAVGGQDVDLFQHERHSLFARGYKDGQRVLKSTKEGAKLYATVAIRDGKVSQ